MELLYALLIGIVLINLASVVLWFWLLNLVRTADEILSFRTASMYTRYLFSKVMEGRFFRAPKSIVLGNPERDPIVREVRGSSQFATIEWVASWIRDVPLNLVPFLL